MPKLGKFFVYHNSETTGSLWEVELDESGYIRRAFLNGKKINLTEAREEIVYNYLDKHKELGRLQHESYYQENCL